MGSHYGLGDSFGAGAPWGISAERDEYGSGPASLSLTRKRRTGGDSFAWAFAAFPILDREIRSRRRETSEKRRRAWICKNNVTRGALKTHVFSYGACRGGTAG